MWRRRACERDCITVTTRTDGALIIVPISVWREIESERETAYLLQSNAMKRRLLEAKQRQEGVPLEAVVEKFGI